MVKLTVKTVAGAAFPVEVADPEAKVRERGRDGRAWGAGCRVSLCGGGTRAPRRLTAAAPAPRGLAIPRGPVRALVAAPHAGAALRAPPSPRHVFNAAPPDR